MDSHRQRSVDRMKDWSYDVALVCTLAIGIVTGAILMWLAL